MALKVNTNYNGLGFISYAKIDEIFARFTYGNFETINGVQNVPVEVRVGFYAITNDNKPASTEPVYTKYYERVLIPKDSTNILQDIYNVLKTMDDFAGAEDI